MKCPYCQAGDSKVINSRPVREGDSIRRRRECIECLRRFTTFEQIEYIPVMIVKKDGRRETFNRDKIRLGIQSACQKRNVSATQIEAFLDDVACDIKDAGQLEIEAALIGEKVMTWLHTVDAVAYVRFASVYREFKDVNDFAAELQSMSHKQGPGIP